VSCKVQHQKEPLTCGKEVNEDVRGKFEQGGGEIGSHEDRDVAPLRRASGI